MYVPYRFFVVNRLSVCLCVEVEESISVEWKIKTNGKGGTNIERRQRKKNLNESSI